MRRLTGPVAAVVVLVLFVVGLMASLRGKGMTYDEMGHATAGYTYWHYNDYRLDPENGNLPKRLMALPLVLERDRFQFPRVTSAGWRMADVWALGREWFQSEGNDEGDMLWQGRMAMSLVAVALGAVVWFWSRRLFGPMGAMVSLLLYVFSPIILANGALMTSDATSALFFFAATGSLWAVLHRVTPGRVLLGGLCVGALCVAKMSAILIAPIALILFVVRLVDGRPLAWTIGRPREIAARGRQAAALVAVGLVQVVVAWVVIWGFYGFRFSAFGPDAGPPQFPKRWEVMLGQEDPIDVVDQLPLTDAQRARMAQLMPATNTPLEPWTQPRLDAFAAIRREVLTPAQVQQVDVQLAAPPREWPVRLADYARQHHWLPESYLYGQSAVWRFARSRLGFFNGRVHFEGDAWFFPYAFLVKTPLSAFALGALAVAAGVAVARRRKQRGTEPEDAAPAGWATLYDTLPLWTLTAIYLATVMASNLNIGHRHLLAIYPPLLVLAGASGLWLGEAARSHRALAWTTGALLVALAGEIGYRFPNYIAYFNVIAGGPAGAYHHFVDSSLDWGQDLPGVKAYLQRHPSGGPFYLSYFGIDDPACYGIAVNRLYSSPAQDVPPPLFSMTLRRDQWEVVVKRVQHDHPDYEVAGVIPQAGDQVEVVMLKTARSLRWTGGTYLISATMVQPLNYVQDGPLGPWNQRFETTYQELAHAVAPVLSDDVQARSAELRQHAPSDWQSVLARFEAYRFARLTAFLREREPDETINYSILVYHLSDADIARALQGPPPPFGVDLPKVIQEWQDKDERAHR